MIYHDEIIAEVWQNRDAYVAKHHNNLNEIVADLRDRQKRPGCKLVDKRDQSHRRNWSFSENHYPQA